jgi:hypothetical protein
VRDGENGLLYDPRQRKGALAPIQRLLASRGLARELARMGRKAAESASWEAETLRLVAAYEQARARVTKGTFLFRHLFAARDGRTMPLRDDRTAPLRHPRRRAHRAQGAGASGA